MAAVRAQRVVTLDVLFKPRPADTEKDRADIKHKKQPIDPPLLLWVTVAWQLISDVCPDEELRQH